MVSHFIMTGGLHRQRECTVSEAWGFLFPGVSRQHQLQNSAEPWQDGPAAGETAGSFDQNQAVLGQQVSEDSANCLAILKLHYPQFLCVRQVSVSVSAAPSVLQSSGPTRVQRCH